MIEAGQIYRSLGNRHHPVDGPTRIKIISHPVTTPGLHGFGKVEAVTLTRSGREVRRRRISLAKLHEHTLAGDGTPRRTGYVRETPTPPGTPHA